MYTVPVPEGKFNQDARLRLGEAIYLLGYLIRSANWKTGRLCATRERIAADTGFPERTIVRWLGVLSEAGEISTRRTTRGTLIQLNDYASVARTRGVEHQPRTRHSDEPRAAGPCATGGSTHAPRAARPLCHPRLNHCAAGGSTNIRRNMVQSTSPSFVRKGSSCGDEGKAPPSGRSRETCGHPVEFRPQWPKLIRATRRKLESLPEEERERLRHMALERMASDPRPFVRIFVQPGPSGLPEPKGRPGEEMMLRVLADMMERESADVVEGPMMGERGSRRAGLPPLLGERAGVRGQPPVHRKP